MDLWIERTQISLYDIILLKTCLELDMKKISVIIPLYKGERYIKKLIKCLLQCSSVLREIEDFQMEVIFVNDDPETKINTEHFEISEFKVKVIQNEKNCGIHYSRVDGLRHAQGDYVLFLDQDDYINPEYFVSQFAHIGNDNVVICNGKYRNDREIIFNEKEAGRIADINDYFSTLSGIISPGQAIIRKNCIPKEWTENILLGNYCDDAFLWLLLKDKGEKFAINREILYFHNEDGSNTSLQWNHTAVALAEMYDVIEKKSLLKERNRLILKKCIQEKINKHTQYFWVEQKLQELYLKKMQLSKYMEQNEINTLAIYGYGVLGRKILSYLEDCNIKVEYVIDESAEAFEQDNWQIKTLKDQLDEVDLVVITPIFAFESIREELNKKIHAKCMPLNEFCDEVLRCKNCAVIN